VNRSTLHLFHGWYVAATLSICGIVLYGGGLYSFILFVTPLSNEFHWSRAATGTLVSAFWLGAPLVLLSDRLLRRFSILQLVLTGIAIEAGCLMILFLASELWQMYTLRTLAGVGKILYAISIPAMLSRWFSRRFGFALAIVYSGWHIGGLALAPIAQQLIDSLGWRMASTMIGLLIVLVAVPPALLFLRTSSAASMGLGLDGDPPEPVGSLSVAPASTPNSGARGRLRQVLKTKAFWLLTPMTFLYCLTYSGVLAHQSAMIEGLGISGRVAALVLGSTAGFAIVGALLLGWLIDRYPMRRAITLQFAMMLFGIGCLLKASQTPVLSYLVMHAVAFGFAVGGSDIFLITVLKRRIPEPLFPMAYGIWYFFTLLGVFGGPYPAGLLFDLSGSYVKSLIVESLNLVVPYVLTMWAASLPPPNKEAAAAEP
jgi:MFS family permease